MSHTQICYYASLFLHHFKPKVERWSLLKHWIRLYASLVEHEVSHTVNSCLTFKYLNGFSMERR